MILVATYRKYIPNKSTLDKWNKNYNKIKLILAGKE